MGVDADLGGLSLAEDFGEAHRGNAAGIDQVGQYGARPHRGQLIDVTNDEQGGVIRDGFQKLVHQDDVHHGGFVDDEEIQFERLLLVALEGEDLGIEFQEAMDGFGVEAGGFREAFGRTAGGGAELDLDPLGHEDLQQAVDQGGFADAGPAGDDGDLAAHHQPDGLALRVRE